MGWFGIHKLRFFAWGLALSAALNSVAFGSYGRAADRFAEAKSAKIAELQGRANAGRYFVKAVALDAANTPGPISAETIRRYGEQISDPNFLELLGIYHAELEKAQLSLSGRDLIRSYIVLDYIQYAAQYRAQRPSASTRALDGHDDVGFDNKNPEYQRSLIRLFSDEELQNSQWLSRPNMLALAISADAYINYVSQIGKYHGASQTKRNREAARARKEIAKLADDFSQLQESNSALRRLSTRERNEYGLMQYATSATMTSAIMFTILLRGLPGGDLTPLGAVLATLMTGALKLPFTLPLGLEIGPWLDANIPRKWRKPEIKIQTQASVRNLAAGFENLKKACAELISAPKN